MSIDTEEIVIEHHQEINDIITAVPGWLTRWGALSIFLILILAILGISVFPIYSTEFVQVLVKSEKAVERISSPRKFILAKMLVHDGEKISNKQPLAITIGPMNEIDTLKSAMSGTIHFLNYLVSNSEIENGSELFSISPLNSTLYGEAELTDEQMKLCSMGEKIRLIGQGLKTDEYGVIIFLANSPLFNNKYKIRLRIESSLASVLPYPHVIKGEISGQKEMLLKKFTSSFFKY